jgi:rubrerythrin
MGRDMWVNRRNPEKTLAKHPLDNTREYCPRCWEEFAISLKDWREVCQKIKKEEGKTNLEQKKAYWRAARENDSFHVHRVLNLEDRWEVFYLCPACGTAFQDPRGHYLEPPLLYEILYLAKEETND